MKVMLGFLTHDRFSNISRKERNQMLKTIFIDNPGRCENDSSSLKKPMIRLHEILSRSESFEVVSPLETSSSDIPCKPTNVLTNQLRIRLIENDQNIPSSYRQSLASNTVATSLLPFGTRYLLFQSTYFGYSRSVARWVRFPMQKNTQTSPRGDRHQLQQSLLGHMRRQKFKIMPAQISESCSVVRK